jgi:two-component system sensor histidine kinase/response regulator
MKFPLETLNYFQGKIKSFSNRDFRHSVNNGVLSIQSGLKKVSSNKTIKRVGSWITSVPHRTKQRGLKGSFIHLKNRVVDSWYEINSIGATEGMDELEIRRLRIFNQLNFLGIITGVTMPISGLFSNGKLPALTWFVACAPAMISVLVLWLNHLRKYEQGIIVYFIFYPVVTSLVYLGGLNLGIELFFILYGILSVFFIQNVSHMLFSIGLSMVSYFMLAVVLKHYQFQLELANYAFYLFNQVIAIAFIFYGLYLIKEENTGYQWSILRKNRELHRNNLEIEKQKAVIAEKAELLEEQTVQLTELNSLKNKLFSVISHDLKTPMYALRNLFQNVQEYNLPAEEIKKLLPDVVNELNYTTGLMENLLHWAKSQMQANSVRPQQLEIVKVINEVTQLLTIQADAKNIRLESHVDQPFQVYADRDMTNLVLRNLVANAIKFTPENGKITIRAKENRSFIEVSVTDTGVGISKENLDKLFNEYYTSKGTANESGTGLGLMLCKEFLTKNGGQLNIVSEEGIGSTFSFTLPRSEYNFVQQQSVA